MIHYLFSSCSRLVCLRQQLISCRTWIDRCKLSLSTGICGCPPSRADHNAGAFDSLRDTGAKAKAVRAGRLRGDKGRRMKASGARKLYE